MPGVAAGMVQHDADVAREREAARPRAGVAEPDPPQLCVTVGADHDLADRLDAALAALDAQQTRLAAYVVAVGRSGHGLASERPEGAVLLVAQVEEQALAILDGVRCPARDAPPVELREAGTLRAHQAGERAVREQAGAGSAHCVGHERRR